MGDQQHLQCAATSADINKWHPLDCISSIPEEESIALIHLNIDFPKNVNLFNLLWKKACFRACTDGAVNKLYDLSRNSCMPLRPDIITGDFDSARSAVIQYYREQSVEIVNTPCQDETDFTKCLRVVIDRLQTRQLKVSSIVAYTSFGGRFDHTLGSVNTLYIAQKLTSLPVYLISTDSLACLLPPGDNIVHVKHPLRGDHCGLIPIGHPCHHTTTSGLKWNLSDQTMEFGTLISTSNQFTSEPEVKVSSDGHLLWTMSLKCISESK